MAQHSKAAFLGAEAAPGGSALGLVGRVGDDIDDAIDGIGTPQGATRPADDLDAVDVVEEQILILPEDAGEEGIVHDAAVDEDQQLVGETVVEAACGDAPLAGVDVPGVDADGQAQGFGQARNPGAADLLAGEEIDGSGGLKEALLPAGGGEDLDVHQLLQAQVSKIGGADRDGQEEKDYGEVDGLHCAARPRRL